MILSVDVGTSVLKAGLIGLDGRPAGRAEVPVSLAAGEDPLRYEADANNWISALALAVAQLELPRDLRAVVVSGNGPTLVPADADARPLDFAMTWMDRRGGEEAALIAGITGEYVDPTFYLPKALWIYRHNRRVYERTRHFMACPEFVDFYLTGNAFAVLPSEQFSRYIWTAELVERLGMDPAKFPPFIAPGQPVGSVRGQAEEVLGIPAGTPVFAGGPDFIMSLLGTATVRPGRACDRAGTSEGINLCTERPLQDRRLMSLPHIVPGYHNVSGIISTSGKALEWFKTITGRQRTDYESLFEDVLQVPAGSRGLLFLPYLAGERAPLWDTHARGTFIGLTINHGRREMTRAVVEAVGYAIRDVLEVMVENGLAVEELRVTGGQARSPLWNQIKADITGRRILVPENQDSELLGDACVALFALGEHDSLAEAADRVVTIGRRYEPQGGVEALYREMFELYRASYRGLKEVFRRLSEVPKEEP